MCGPTYHWGGLLTAKAEEAKKRYRAIRSNVGENLPNSDKIPTGQLDLQFLIFWIKKSAWDITYRLELSILKFHSTIEIYLSSIKEGVVLVNVVLSGRKGMKQRHYATTKLPCFTMSLSLIGFRKLEQHQKII